ncbi:MAG TPA: thiol reductant ABC exporter subunit CydC [Bellilinea sp.]|nr:thiol reductant ABC exporter subunit CydC [Bellilinea sp.]
MKTTRRLLAFLQPFSGWVVLSVLVAAGTIAASIGLLGTSAFLIASAALHPSVGDLQVAIVGVRFFGIARAVLRYFERLISHSVNFRLLAQLRGWFYRALEPLAPARLMQIRSGDILQRAIGDIETLENFYVRVVAPPVTALMVTIGISLFVGRYAAILGWILLAGLLFGMLFIPLVAFVQGKQAGGRFIEARAQMNAMMLETVQGQPDLLVFNRLSAAAARIDQFGNQFVQAQRRLNLGAAGLNAINLLTANVTLWLVLWHGVPLVSSGSLDGVSLAVVALLTMASFEAVTPLAQAAQLFQSSLQAANRLFNLAEQQPAVNEPELPQELVLPVSKFELNGIDFRYEDRLEEALHDIHLELHCGKKIAVVGASGAGKSSLINVLLRFWDFQTGEYLLGDQNVRRLTSAAVRSCFSVVGQSAYLFATTLRGNLHLGNPQADDGMMMAALEAAGLAGWAADLPQGLSTWVGEHGLQLSGGERQRLAIARAILQDAPFVLLDEPTAGLDAMRERAVLNTLFSNFAERGILWVTHHLVNMEQMDEIFVLDRGRIAEHGTHQELLLNAGLYCRMWQQSNRLLE